MELREADGADLPRLVDLWLSFAREMASVDDFDALAADARTAARDHRRAQLDRDDVTMLVASVDGDLVAFTTAEHRPAPPVFRRGDGVHVHELYVRPAYRRQGIATSLLTDVREWAAARGCEHLTLDVHVENDAARAFYREHGFDPQRERLVDSVD